jgi:single-strand DNA-binding protein
MAEGLNRVMLLGNLGADPELRYTQAGKAVLNMRLATTESYLDANKVRQERTDWHNVVLWGKRGEALAKFLTKGSTIFVEGGLRTSSYDDKEGNKRYKTEVHATNIILAGRGRGGGGGGDMGEPSGGGGGGGGGRRGGSSGSAPPRDEGPPPDDFGGAGGTGGDDDIPF